VEIHHCTIRDNVASFGGGIYTSVSDVDIHHNVFENNQAGSYGSAISMLGNGASIWNNTFVNNSSVAVHFEYSDEGTIFENNIVDGGSIYFEDSDETIVRYNDFHLVPFYGGKPFELGLITTTNANGDSSDSYYNIFLVPMFVNLAEMNFNLQQNSPAIDAGNPLSVLDPDGTTADLGAFYYDQSSGYMVSVSLTPFNVPIQIPANGGNFSFNIEVANNEAMPTVMDIWTMATLPNGSEYGPIINYSDFNAPANWMGDRDRNQAVPANAPDGDYTYDVYAGVYPDEIWAEDHFAFAKLTTIANGGFIYGWQNTGEEFGELGKIQDRNQESTFANLEIIPNPFNPVTNLSFNLSEAGEVKLTIHDVLGREILSLSEGIQPAGQHQIVFNGVNLPSGIYFAKLQTDSKSEIKKMTLLK
jgi:hypothetical protein